METHRDVKYQRVKNETALGLFVGNNAEGVKQLEDSRTVSKVLRCIPRFRKLLAACHEAAAPEARNRAYADMLNAFEQTLLWRARTWFWCGIEDLQIRRQQAGQRQEIDRSDRSRQDYYSVAVIVKNEARYIREFILFYQATGADRIYLYDNDSTDDLMDQIRPFLDSGLVVYRRWPGKRVQAAAYRDVVRRSRGRTRWLAIIDADEYLFSPRGPVPEQLKAYEAYPGVGVNWLMYGPNGHDRRPAGLIMDNYTTRVASPDSVMNCHIKSIVQPRQVSLLFHVHYAVYRGGRYAVNEDGEIIDNTCAFIQWTGRAFTARNHSSVFRINHYATKSLEDLEAKCARGYADGAPNAVFENQLKPYKEPLVEDAAIRPYADLVRERLKAYGPQTKEQDGTT